MPSLHLRFCGRVVKRYGQCLGSARWMKSLPAGWDQRRLRLRSPLLPALAVRPRLVERVGARKSLRRQPSGIGAIAAPIGKLLEREREGAAGGVGPREPLLRLEGLEVAQPAILVALQPHAASSRHLR